MTRTSLMTFHMRNISLFLRRCTNHTLANLLTGFSLPAPTNKPKGKTFTVVIKRLIDQNRKSANFTVTHVIYQQDE